MAKMRFTSCVRRTFAASPQPPVSNLVASPSRGCSIDQFSLPDNVYLAAGTPLSYHPKDHELSKYKPVSRFTREQRIRGLARSPSRSSLQLSVRTIGARPVCSDIGAKPSPCIFLSCGARVDSKLGPRPGGRVGERGAPVVAQWPPIIGWGCWGDDAGDESDYAAARPALSLSLRLRLRRDRNSVSTATSSGFSSLISSR